MRTEEPRAIHLADYKAPDFRIETVHLDFALDPQATRVTSRLKIVRISSSAREALAGEVAVAALAMRRPEGVQKVFAPGPCRG